MREIKFRAWDEKKRVMYMPDTHEEEPKDEWWGADWDVFRDALKTAQGRFILMQFTGLNDKNGDAEIYECDIIDSNGNKKGNTYEMDAGETDLVIQEFGGKDWFTTYKEAMARGCKHA